MAEQDSLFPAPDEEPPRPGMEVGMDAYAKAIGDNAPADPYASQNARKEAIIDLRGEDLGGEQTGLRRVSEAREAIDGAADDDSQTPKKLYEKPRRGRSNTPGPARKYSGLSDHTIQTGLSGIANARRALDNPPPEQGL